MKKEKKPTFQEALIARLHQYAPRGDKAVETYGTWEVASSKDDVLSKIRYVLTTGITAFDDIVGGMPFGRIVEVYGQESCGKTALALRCAGRAQLGSVCEVIRDGDGIKGLRKLKSSEFDVGVLYIDNEQSLDDDEKIKCDGHDLDIGIARCDTVAGVFKMVEHEIDETEKWQANEPDKLHFLVVVVDTIASTSTKEDLNAAWGTRDFPRVPYELGKGFSRLVRRINACNAILICTNQVRVDYVAAGDRNANRKHVSYQYRSLGGKALKYYASHRVFMDALSSSYKLTPTAQFAAGLNIQFRTVKNRLRMPHRDGRMALLFDEKKGGFNEPFSMLETLLLYKFIEMDAETKNTGYRVKFMKNGVVPTTFGAEKITTTLEEDDAKLSPRRGPSRKDPTFKNRADWPAFYAAHRADIDALWAKAVQYAFNTPGLSEPLVEDEEDIENAPNLED